ncbi:MAG: hypothetical protein K1V84_03425 [Muribaculaceae bacterium]
MNKKQIKDLQSVLRSIELNEMIFSNIQQLVEKEKFVIEERRDNYESKGSDYWDNKAIELDDRIDVLDEEAGALDEIASSLRGLIELMREKIGKIEGNAVKTPYRVQMAAIAKKGKDLITKRDPMFEEIARFVVLSNTASTSSIQRRYSIGYNRAGKIMDELEAAGIVGVSQGGKPRAVLVDTLSLERILNSFS